MRFVIHSLANARCRIVLLSLLILNFTVSEVLKRILRFMSLRVRTAHGPLYTSHRVTGTHFIIAWREINSTARNRKIWLFKRVKYLWLIKFSELPVSLRAYTTLEYNLPAFFILRVTTETRHSINSGPLCATDHLFATRVIKVNESSAARVGPMARRKLE